MKQYSVREALPQEAQDTLKAYPKLLRTLLYYRGIDTAEKAEAFLHPSYEELHDPYALKDMDKAVTRILEAITENERMLIYSDYDADGIPAAVVLTDFFKMIGYQNFEIYIPHRHSEGFGLHLEAIDTFKDRVKLLITLDCGIADYDEVKHAQDAGIDVIITDHHQPNGTLPPAHAIVNPKQSDCKYPFDHLCGSGVAFKLIQALIVELKRVLHNHDRGVRAIVSQKSAPAVFENDREVKTRLSEVKDGQEKWLLDMVGLATLSDMVDLTGENRILAYYGLKVLRKTRRPGLQKLLRKLKIEPTYLTEDDIGFMISPRINAASRMGIPMDAYTLLSTDDEAEAGMLAEHLDSINNERKGIVASTVKELKKILAERQDHYAAQPLIVLGNPNWRPALLGLAANSLVEEHGKPVFLWGREEGKDIKGSCRSNGAVDLVKLMEAAKHAFLEFGGHTMSGGFSVHHEKIHHLEDELVKAYESARNKAHIPEMTMPIDAMLLLDDINPTTYELIDKLSPFGKGNEKPMFLFENIQINTLRQFGKTQEHLELSFLNSRNKPIKAVGFFTKPEDFEHSPKQGGLVDLVATLEKSYFMNRPELRLRIVDII